MKLPKFAVALASLAMIPVAAGCVSVDAPTACALDAAACSSSDGAATDGTSGDALADSGDALIDGTDIDSGGGDATDSIADSGLAGDADGGGDADAGCKPAAARCDGKRRYTCAADGLSETFEDCGIGCAIDGCLVPTKVVAGGDYTCALMGSGALYCWGANNNGQLGDGTRTQREKPVLVMSDAIDVAVGFQATCAVRKDNAVVCWGVVLGATTPTEKLTPSSMPGISATQVTCGLTHCCALLKDASVACWGDNSDGALGDGGDINRSTPGIVPGLTSVSFLRCGGASCFAKAGTTWKAWGDAYYGQLGEGSSTKVQRDPVDVPALATYAEACVGSTFGCGRNGTTASCWGLQNDVGQLGSGDKSTSATPRPVVGGASVASLTWGPLATVCGTTSTGVVCWGANNAGQIGDGSTTARLSAFPVPSTSPVVSVAVGRSHTCAAIGQSVQCWGSNSKGEMGNGTVVPSTSPKPAVW